MSGRQAFHFEVKLLLAFLLFNAVNSQLSLDPYCSNNRPSLTVLPETCCPIPNFFDDDILTACKSKRGTEGLLRDPLIRTRRYATSRMELGTCYLDCVFQLYGITSVAATNRQPFDTNKLLKILAMETPQDPESTNVITTSLSQCINDLNSGNLKLRSSWLYNCSTIPSTLMLCVHRKFFQNCPSTRFSTIPQCVQLREYLTRCPVII